MSTWAAITISRVIFSAPIQVVTNFVESMEDEMDKEQLVRCVRHSRLSGLFKSDLLKVIDKISPSEFLLALRTGRQTHLYSLINAPKVELAWTGPKAVSVPLLRSNLGILLDTINGATNRIFLTGYALSADTELTQEVVKYLSEARSRGCNVTIAINEPSKNFEVLRKLWPKSVLFPTVLVWKQIGQDQMTSLHAKVLIVDGEKLFITSANLTYHGLHANIEVGALISSPIANSLEQHFNMLKLEGILHSI